VNEGQKIAIGINGFGRIGRYVCRLCLDHPNIQLTSVNDLSDIQTLAHLLKYDSVHGRLKWKFRIEGQELVFEHGKRIHFSQHPTPGNIPWDDYGVQTVLECSGQFLTQELALGHLSKGVRRVILSAPPKDTLTRTVVMGVNEHLLERNDTIISNASCTTNNAAPMLKVLRGICDIESAYITTVHSYTSDQRLHDSPHVDLRRARGAAQSIIPTTTGAAKALTRVFPDLEGKIGGCGVRVPVANGSFTDITMVVRNPPSVEAINRAMESASKLELKGILDYTEDPIVSVDVLGVPSSCIVDAQLTSVVNNLVKVVGWYDNESGYSNRLLDLVSYCYAQHGT
jgi:glyceraldehyde 3-phosphate dehydrogenase